MQIEVYRSMDQNIPVSAFDMSKAGSDFGFHFGTKESAMHRGQGKQKYFLKKYILNISSPITLSDPGIWNLKEIFRQLIRTGKSTKEEEQSLVSLASKNAKEKGTAMPIEQNLLLAKYLTEKGYDSIIYENRGESGGKAYIVWDKSKITEIDTTINEALVEKIIFEEYQNILKEIEPYQKLMHKKHKKWMIRLVTKGKGKKVAPFNKNISIARGKSAPPGI